LYSLLLACADRAVENIFVKASRSILIGGIARTVLSGPFSVLPG